MTSRILGISTVVLGLALSGVASAQDPGHPPADAGHAAAPAPQGAPPQAPPVQAAPGQPAAGGGRPTLRIIRFGDQVMMPPPGGAPAAGHGDPNAHGAAGEHGAAAGEHGGGHGGGEHHTLFLADDDADGIANWQDQNSDAYQVTKLFFHFVNLVLLVGLLLAFARTPILDGLRARAAEIRKALTESAQAREAARQRQVEMAARLEKIGAEVDKIRADARADSAREQERTLERARIEADRIIATAQRNVQDEVVRARNDLRREAIDLAVQLAESVLAQSVQATDQRRLAGEFLDTIRQDGANGHG
jgi:F-type H+-transporting ATPase subunit b